MKYEIIIFNQVMNLSQTTTSHPPLYQPPRRSNTQHRRNLWVLRYPPLSSSNPLGTENIPGSFLIRFDLHMFHFGIWMDL